MHDKVELAIVETKPLSTLSSFSQLPRRWAEQASEFFGDVVVASSGSYPFADQCPLIVFRKPLRR